MSVVIEDKDGNPVTVFLTIQPGQVDAIIRATSKADWAMGAYYYGLIDSDGNPSPGVHLSEMGPAMVTPGDELTPAVMDTRYHVNMRLVEPSLSVVDDATGYQRWMTMACNWTRLGVPDAQVNKAEVGVEFADVVLIDPDSVQSPQRVWL